jgi:glucose/arabinose dehydrogenase
MKIPSLLLVCLAIPAAAQNLERHDLKANGKPITLAAPSSYDVSVALDGLRRVRFMSKSPDGRIFATDMYSRADNSRGKLLILDGWDAKSGSFQRGIPYLQGLRNPNNVAFHTDESRQTWLYLPLTDRLLRYRYKAGDMAPTGEPEVLARYPDYGLNYKYGGWHLTRTVAFGKVNGRERLFVAVGSSCNACVETEPVRASLIVMDVDGKHPSTLVKNLRNAVGLHWDDSKAMLIITNMGSDQFGDRAPDDTLLAFSADEIASVERTAKPLDAGWPACYFDHGKLRADPTFAASDASACQNVRRPVITFPAHSSPLGVEEAGDGSYLVALHGSGHPRVGTGYKIVRVTGDGRTMQDFLTGFLSDQQGKPHVYGRPCGLLQIDAANLLVTDDYLGAIYIVHRKR